jgi:hypothetical protein
MDLCLMVLQGGLGNQLFQLLTGIEYACKHGKTLRLAQVTSNRRPYYWDTVLQKYAHLLMEHKDIPANTVVYMEPHTNYQELPLIPGNVCFYGYFQSLKYFSYVLGSMDLISSLGLTSPRLPDNAVIVHARRGDYLSLSDVHPVQTEKYYSDAAAIMESMVSDPYFILLSDDDQYWSERASGIFNRYVVWLDSCEVNTLAMMVGASNFIIANSTYSWWGAVLSKAKNVIAPERWYGEKSGRGAKDIYLDHWIRL